MQCCYGADHREQSWLLRRDDSDASIVSRFRILTNIAASGGRGVTIELAPGQRAHFFNCTWRPILTAPTLARWENQNFVIDVENSTRMPALNKLLSAMAPHIAAAEPCFLTGDFNAPSHFDYTAYPGHFDRLHERRPERFYFVAHPNNRQFPGPFAFNEPGITWTPLTNEEPHGVFDRIDFVYFSAGDGVAVKSSTELDGGTASIRGLRSSGRSEHFRTDAATVDRQSEPSGSTEWRDQRCQCADAEDTFVAKLLRRRSRSRLSIYETEYLVLLFINSGGVWIPERLAPDHRSSNPQHSHCKCNVIDYSLPQLDYPATLCFSVRVPAAV